MTDRYLWIQTSSGLASRMRAVVGALAYCKATDRRLIVDWPYEERSETLGCFPAKFRDLWSNTDIEETDCKQRFQGLRPDNTHLLAPDNDQLKLRTCHIEPFMPWIPEQKPGKIANLIYPSLAVQEQIDKVMPLLLNEGEYFVGINIRHALKQPSVASVDWFIERMRSMPEHVHFFASLDDRQISEQLLATFPDRVIELDKTYVYDRDGIIKTCADLYLLASCDYLIGSNYSSYSQMAAFLRGAKYLGPHDKPERGLECDSYEDLWNQPLHVSVAERAAVQLTYPSFSADDLLTLPIGTATATWLTDPPAEAVPVVLMLDEPKETIVVSPADVGSIEDVLPKLKDTNDTPLP